MAADFAAAMMDSDEETHPEIFHVDPSLRPHDPHLKRPPTIVGYSEFRRHPGPDDDPHIIKIYGEQHSASADQKKATEMQRFFENELAADPKAHLYIEATNMVEPPYLQSVINSVGQRITRSSLAPKITLFDKRKDPHTYPSDVKFLHGLNEPHPNQNLVMKRRAQDFVRGYTKVNREGLPRFNRIVEEHIADKNFGGPKPKAPILDNDMLNIINDSVALHQNPVFYVGDAHRRNVSEALRDIPKFKPVRWDWIV